MSKADYVRAAIVEGSAGKHHCHWPGCEKAVPPAAWGCRQHWYRLPIALRNKVWAAFRPGQEQSKTPSRRYVEVAREVQDWIDAQGIAARSDTTRSGVAEGKSPVAQAMRHTSSSDPL